MRKSLFIAVALLLAGALVASSCRKVSVKRDVAQADGVILAVPSEFLSEDASVLVDAERAFSYTGDYTVLLCECDAENAAWAAATENIWYDSSCTDPRQVGYYRYVFLTVNNVSMPYPVWWFNPDKVR